MWYIMCSGLFSFIIIFDPLLMFILTWALGQDLFSFYLYDYIVLSSFLGKISFSVELLLCSFDIHLAVSE